MSENKQNTTLGCGTLILVALIVLIFSRGSDDEVKQAVKTLDAKMTLIMEHLDIPSPETSVTNSQSEAGAIPDTNE